MKLTITKSIKQHVASMILAGLALVFGSTLLNAQIVSAHTLKVDRAIGVTVHITPDDEPVVGAQSQIMIGIQDKEGRFNTAAGECICAVTVLLNGLAVETLPFIMTGSTAMVTYKFQQSAVYKLEVSGSSRQPGSFQNFSTSYSYRVAGGNGAESSSVEEAKNPLQTYLVFVVIGVASLLAVLWMLPVPKFKKRGKK